MHSIAIASIMVAAATLTTAAPAVQRRANNKLYYLCANNGFKGDCSVDPCNLSWCPDYKLKTYQPAKLLYLCANNGFNGECSVDPCNLSWCPDYEFGTYQPAKPAETPKPAPAYYVCSNNGFKGVCSVDPCALPWCPDVPKPVDPKPVDPKPVDPKPVDPKPNAPAYYVCANNGFKGVCSVDPCALPWCPDSPNPVKESEKKTPEPTSVPVSTTKKEHYVCSSNGFVGDCSVDACNVAWCPDYEYKTYKPVTKTTKRSDPTVCAPGTGYFQSCSNGFRGCCKSDACGSKTQWCPDYKPWTFEPVTTASQTETVPKTENTPVSVYADCAPGAGFYQVCGNGFKGCCKYDACTLGYCPSN